jgi:hypothetical protein
LYPRTIDNYQGPVIAFKNKTSPITFSNCKTMSLTEFKRLDGLNGTGKSVSTEGKSVGY